jgi:hypothetical protein
MDSAFLIRSAECGDEWLSPNIPSVHTAVRLVSVVLNSLVLISRAFYVHTV